MDRDVVKELTEQGRINAELIEVVRSDTGERTALSERDQAGLTSDDEIFDYYLIDTTAEELVDLIRDITPDVLFSYHVGPFHRIDTNVEQSENLPYR